MKEILDEEIKERIVTVVKVVPRYMVIWHSLLSFLFLFNLLIKSHQSHPVAFFQGLVVTHLFLLFITMIRKGYGKINKGLIFSFWALSLINLVASLSLLGDGIFMWMAVNMGATPAINS